MIVLPIEVNNTALTSSLITDIAIKLPRLNIAIFRSFYHDIAKANEQPPKEL